MNDDGRMKWRNADLCKSRSGIRGTLRRRTVIRQVHVHILHVLARGWHVGIYREACQALAVKVGDGHRVRRGDEHVKAQVELEAVDE